MRNVYCANYCLSTYKVTATIIASPAGLCGVLIAMRGMYACMALLAITHGYKGMRLDPSQDPHVTLAPSHQSLPPLRDARIGPRAVALEYW